MRKLFLVVASFVLLTVSASLQSQLRPLVISRVTVIDVVRGSATPDRPYTLRAAVREHLGDTWRPATAIGEPISTTSGDSRRGGTAEWSMAVVLKTGRDRL